MDKYRMQRCSLREKNDSAHRYTVIRSANYFASSGAMKTGWQKLGSAWYYFNGSGAMLTGWQNIGGKWYTFSSSGAWVA